MVPVALLVEDNQIIENQWQQKKDYEIHDFKNESNSFMSKGVDSITYWNANEHSIVIQKSDIIQLKIFSKQIPKHYDY